MAFNVVRTRVNLTALFSVQTKHLLKLLNRLLWILDRVSDSPRIFENLVVISTLRYNIRSASLKGTYLIGLISPKMNLIILALDKLEAE